MILKTKQNQSVDSGRFFLHVLFKTVLLHHSLLKELWIMNILKVVRSKSDIFVGRYSIFPGRVWLCVVVRLLVWPHANSSPRRLAPTLMPSNIIQKGKTGLKTSREWGRQPMSLGVSPRWHHQNGSPGSNKILNPDKTGSIIHLFHMMNLTSLSCNVFEGWICSIREDPDGLGWLRVSPSWQHQKASQGAIKF